MSWDAFATSNGVRLKVNDEAFVLVDDIMNSAFRKADIRTRKKTGSADIFLRVGRLVYSDCAIAIQDASGVNCKDGHMSPRKVRKLHKNADWGRVRDDIPRSLKCSSQAFIETCAFLGLGISFSTSNI